MFYNEQTGQATSVIIGEMGDEHNWKSVDNIYINRKYTLIYTNDQLPGRVAKIEIPGMQVHVMLQTLYSTFEGDFGAMKDYRRDVLGSAVEIWGNIKMANKKFKHPHKELYRLIRKAMLGSDENYETLLDLLAAYVAIHHDSFDHACNIHVSDLHDKKIMTRDEFEIATLGLNNGLLDYEMYLDSVKGGIFSLHFPTDDELIGNITIN